MSQIITAFVCKIPSLSTLLSLLLSCPEGYANFPKHTWRSQRSAPVKTGIQPCKTVQIDLKTADIRFAKEQASSCPVFKAELVFNPASPSLMSSIANARFKSLTWQFQHSPLAKTEYANISSEKDEILEELKFSAQGIFTDSENTKINQKDHSAESRVDIKKNKSTDPQEDENNQIDSKTKFTAPANNTTSDSKKEKPADKTESSSFPILSTAEPAENYDDVDLPPIKNQRIKEYLARPSRIKKEALEKQFNSKISKNPKNEAAHWGLFELYHHYMEWSQDTEFYQEDHPFQTLKLLQDIYKQFGENQKIMKYLCQYFIINHLYVESKPYCQKAKKLRPDDVDLHIYADYLNEGKNRPNNPSQNSRLGKSQILLKLLKTKTPSEKLYTIIGKMFADKKKYKLSMKYFQKAVKWNDTYIPGILGLAGILLKLDQHQTALKYYILACQKHPYKSRTPFQQAKAYLNKKSLFKMSKKYQEQINICINSIKTSHWYFFLQSDKV